MADLDGGRAVRGDLRAAGCGASAVPPPRGFLHEEPRVRYLARACRTGIRAEVRSGWAGWRHPSRAGVVPGARMAVSDIPRAQDDLFSPGMTAREKYAALIIGRAGWADLLQY